MIHLKSFSKIASILIEIDCKFEVLDRFKNVVFFKIDI